jgi:hypothetical protein
LRNLGKRLSLGYRALVASLRDLVEDLPLIFHNPLLLAGAAIEIVMVPSTAIALIATYGYLYCVCLGLALETPLIYLFCREVYRQIHLLPMTESFETSPERWNQVLTEFVSDVKDDN